MTVETAATSGASELLFGAAVARNASARPSAPALSFGGQHWTYAEFDAWIDTVATQLAALGVAPGSCVVYLSSARPEVFAAMFALARLGAAFVPVHAASTEAEIARVLEQMRPVGVVADGRSWDTVQRAGAAALSWSLLVGDVDGAAGARPTLATSPRPVGAPRAASTVNPESTVAVIAHTSGTSGHPKAVALTHANLMWSAINALACLDIGDTDRTLVATPLSHIAVLSGLAHLTWIRGGQVVLMPGFEVDAFFDVVAREAITLAFAVPTMLELLARHPRFTGPDLDSVRWVLCGGAPLSPATYRRYAERGIRIVSSYGLTETSAGVTYGTQRDLVDVVDGAGVTAAVAPFAEVCVVATDGTPVAPGQAGEVLVRGPSVAAAYLGPGRRPVAAVDDAGWFHTGDRGVLDDRARLVVSGRLKETIITGGENVDPFEVESELERIPGITEAVVVGIDEPTWGQIVTAVVVTDDGTDADLDRITTLLAPRLSRFKIPRRLETRAELPRNATGKILRRQVLDELGSPLPVQHP